MILTDLLFGDNSGKTSYKQAAYDKYYNDITNSTYDTAFRDMNDYLDSNYAGGARKYKFDTLQSANDAAKNSLANYNATKNQVFGNGLVGNILNPIAQTANAIGDLGGLAISGGNANAWDKSQDAIGTSRDWLSDLGAAGETALTVLPLAKGISVAKAGKAVKAGTATTKQAAKYAASQVPKTLGKTIASGAGYGSAYGLLGGLNDMGAENFDAGNLAQRTVLGGAIAGGISGLGYGAGKLWNKLSTKKVQNPVGGNYEQKLEDYQNALKTLENEGITGSSKDELSTALKKWRIKNSPEKVASTMLGDGTNTIDYQTLREELEKEMTDRAQSITRAIDKVTNGKPTQESTYIYVKPKNLKEAFSNIKSNIPNMANKIGSSKYGSKIKGILKTNTGKIGLGLGGGLLLSNLLSNKGDK